MLGTRQLPHSGRASTKEGPHFAGFAVMEICELKDVALGLTTSVPTPRGPTQCSTLQCGRSCTAPPARGTAPEARSQARQPVTDASSHRRAPSLRVGALDDPRWKLADGPQRYLLRAGAARGGLWGNHGYEAAYAMVYVDADGQPLNGERRYELRFATPPPCGAFWSVTMYDTPDFYLVDNPIDRYSIGDRTAGLQTASDGSLTIVMQRDEPDDPTRRANWLPTPAGTFRPLLRIYEPHDAVFDGTYELPPITSVH